jgi:drug/metabolite transporter (DMT)-like permease
VTIHPLGVLLGLVAAAWQVVFVTVSRGRFTTVPAEQAMGWAIGATAVACAIATLASGGPLGVVFAQPGALAIVAFTGIFAAGIPSILFLTGIRAIGGTRAGILMLFEPLVGVTLAALLLHEALAPVQVAGGVAILAAAILLQRGAPAGETMEPAAVPSVEHG